MNMVKINGLLSVLALTAVAGLSASQTPKQGEIKKVSGNKKERFEQRMHDLQLKEVCEILGVAAIVRTSQDAAKKRQPLGILKEEDETLSAAAKRQDLDQRKCIAISSPSMAFICTCPEHKLKYSSSKK